MPYRYSRRARADRSSAGGSLWTRRPQSPGCERVQLTYDYRAAGGRPGSQPVSYEALSYTHTARRRGRSRAAARREDTQLPPGDAIRARARWRSQLRAAAGSEAAFVQRGARVSAHRRLRVLARPAAPGPDSVDDFLFNTRAGFCGHYASAFALLMRGAGVPARVVTGYLGGEWNPIGGYFLVRQSDAHAWAEVWLAGRGWTRIDPTAVVAPERLRRGILDLLPGALYRPRRLLHASAVAAATAAALGCRQSWWNEHVVKFDHSTPARPAEPSGNPRPDVRSLGWAFAAALLRLAHAHRLAQSGVARAAAAARCRLECATCACAASSRALRRAAPAHQGPLELRRHGERRRARI